MRLRPIISIAVGALLAIGAVDRSQEQTRWPACAPVDSAAAILVRVIDSASHRPLSLVNIAAAESEYARTDSLGFACMREIPVSRQLVKFARVGYRDTAVALDASTLGGTARGEVAMRRVERPCCDLRGEWSIRLQLDSAAPGAPKPAGRVTSGTIRFGYVDDRLGADADVDDEVRSIAGRFDVDLAPFFGGPYARDVSTTIVSGGPDLLREAVGTIPFGDRVQIGFIPRMSHGGLSLWGTISGDTVRGEWEQNAYAQGATGRFEMTRVAAFDPAKAPRDSTPMPVRRRPSGSLTHVSPDSVPAGQTPGGPWRPETGIGPDGSIWMAPGGLFVAQSFGGSWRRVLGGPTGPVTDYNMNMGASIAVPAPDTVVVGMGYRHSIPTAPTLYRSTDRGQSWRAVPESRLQSVYASTTVGRTVLVVGGRHWVMADAVMRSDDAGATWSSYALPKRIFEPHVIATADARTIYIGGKDFEDSPPLSRSTDGGRTWRSLPTPSDQGFRRKANLEGDVFQIAIAGPTLLVTQKERVYASDTGRIRWREVPGAMHVASEAGDPRVFVVAKDLRARLLDPSLREIWSSASPIPLGTGYIQQVLWRNGIGYVSTGGASLFEVRDGSVRVLTNTPAAAMPR